MDNELTPIADTPDSTTSPEESAEQLYNPGAIYLLARDFMDQEHDEAIAKLKDVYTTYQWEDQDQAAKNFSDAADLIHKFKGVTPESNLQENFAEAVHVVLSPRFDDETKLNKINEVAAAAKANAASDPKDVDSLVNAKQLERDIDAIKLTLRRSVISKDTGRLGDAIARFANSAVTPLAGIVDMALDTDYGKQVQEYTIEHTKAEYDSDITSVIASAAGSITGAAASGIAAGPWGAAAYLGSQIATEAKNTYDTTLADTGNTDLAEEAVVKNLPAHIVAAFGDKVMGGTIAKILARKGGAATIGKGIFQGVAVEGLGETFEEYWTGKTLTEATGNPVYTPTEKQLLNVFLGSSIVGGAIGGAGGLSTKYNAAAQKFSKAIEEGTAVEINGETIEDPQGFINKLAQKVGFDQFLRNRAKEEGRPVQEIYEEEGIESGPEFFDEVADEIINSEGLVDEETAVHRTRRNALGMSDRKIQEGKGYYDENYSFIQPVKITFSDGTVSYDAIKGLNKGHALARAKMNWEGENIEAISLEEAPEDIRAEIGLINQGVADSQVNPGSTPVTENAPEATQAFSPDFGHAWPLSESAAPMTFGVKIAQDLGVKLTAGLLKKRTLGTHLRTATDAPSQVTLLRDLFRNPKAVLQTFWHELFHGIDMEAAIADGIVTDPITVDTLERHRQNPAWVKMKRIYDNFVERGLAEEKDTFTKESQEINDSWVPFSKEKDPEYTAYRARGTEQYANTMAAIMTNPERVRDNYPTVWKVFKESVAAHPALFDLVSMLDKARNDPSVLSGTYSELSAKGRKKEVEIMQKAAKQRAEQQKKSFMQAPAEAAKTIYRSLFTQFATVDKAVNTLVKAGKYTKEQAVEAYNQVIKPQNIRDDINRLFDAPAEKTIKKLISSVSDSADVALGKLADFMNLRHILEDTNETLDEIKTHPNEYKEALAYVADKLDLPEWNRKVEGLEGEDLIVKMSSLLVELDNKTRHELQQAARKDEQTFVDKLLEDDTFRVRRLMANYGVDYLGAEALYSTKKQEAGFDPITGDKGEFEHYETALKEIHSLGYRVISEMDKAGLLTAKNKDKLVRNVEHYATQNVLKYFEQDPRIKPSIRKAIGSLELTGNPVTSFISKMEALYARAVYQQSQNTVVNIAKDSGELVTEVKPKRTYGTKEGQPKVYFENVYDKRVALEQKNPSKSYFISTEDGIARLWEIDNPDYKKVFSKSYLAESTVGGALVKYTDALNKMLLAHWTKTLGSMRFVWASQRYDTIREAMRANSKELNITHLFGWFRHMDSNLYALKKAARERAESIVDTGEVDPRTQYFIDKGFRPSGISREYGGRTEINTVQHLIYQLAGDYVEGSEDLWLPDKINKKALAFLHKLPLMKRIQRRGEIDELATKLAGLEIETKYNKKGPWEASRLANELYGTPDPGIGGSEMPALNHLFMFSRAGANGARALVTMAKDDPKGFAFQVAYRKILPWMYTSGAIMGPIIGSLFGDDMEEVYRKYLGKFASYHREGKNLIPMGFIDQNNNFRFFTSTRPSEVLPSWKGAAIALNHERGLVTMGQAMSPMLNFIEDLLDTGTISGKRIAQDSAAAFKQIAGGSMSPGLQFGVHMATTGGLMVGNPQDYFRKQGILDKDVAEAGSLYQKFVDYALWTFYENYPAMLKGFSKEKTRTTEPTSFFDILGKVPQLGPTLKGFALVTNYGDVERSIEGGKIRDNLDASLRLTMGDNTKDALREAKSYAGMVRGYSKNDKKWRDAINDPALERKIDTFNKWYYGDYIQALREMRDAQSMGDIEKRNRIRDSLEKTATRLLNKWSR